LRRLLSDDLNSNLFVSEAQGNLVANELLLGYDGAAGEFWRYGYRANRTHDVHVNPLALLSSHQQAIVRGHSSMRNRFLHALRHERFALLVMGVCLILAAYFARCAWPGGD